MQCFVGDLLDSSAMDQGQLSLELGAHPIEPIVADAFDVLTPLASDRSVTLVAAASPSAIAWCDRRRALQVLLNLISNAVRFAKEGGLVAVRASVAGRRVDIAITDDGVGIPPALGRQLFEPFAHSTDARKTGHGLGLFISRRIAQALDGEVSLEPSAGAGSTFHFTLPLAPERAP
jgi:signal transduction histidine kinase